MSADVILFTPPTTPTALLQIMKGLDSMLEPIPGAKFLAGILMVEATK